MIIFLFYVFLFLFTHLYYFVRNYKHKHIFIVQKYNFQYPLASRPFQILVTIKFPDNAFTPVSQTSSIPQPQIFFILFSLKFIAKLTLVSISSFSKVQQLNNHRIKAKMAGTCSYNIIFHLNHFIYSVQTNIFFLQNLNPHQLPLQTTVDNTKTIFKIPFNCSFKSLNLTITN